MDALVRGLAARNGGNVLKLAAQTILLPTRRSCRSLREAFLRASNGELVLLPRMVTIGDPDEDDIIAGLVEPPELPPAVSGIRRQILLARLVEAMRWEGRAPTPDQAARLAKELGDFLDQVQNEGLDFAALDTLVPDDYADHWQLTLEFLKILTGLWPTILAEQDGIDPALRRVRLLEAQAANWRRAPPVHPVIAAGIAGSLPAANALLGVIARMPNGAVVLPGFDPSIDKEVWEAVGPMHPLFGIRKLLDSMDAVPSDVKRWEAEKDTPTGAVPVYRPPKARITLVAEALRPAETAEAWTNGVDLPPEATEDLYRIDCAGPREEAGTIALILREAIETPGRTAALITPDRALARRVAAEVRRFGVDIDDSGGTPLSMSRTGAFLRLLVQAVDSHFAPHAFLALMKHPLAALNYDPPTLRARVRRVERDALRGPRPAPGIAGICPRCSDMEDIAWLERLEDLLRPLSDLMAQETAPLSELVRVHMECAEALAASHDLPGQVRLWRGEDGAAMARFAADLMDAAPLWGDVPTRRYPALLDVLMQGQVVRPMWGKHPRINIWGLLEARLQQADVVVLGGLNEGVWPAEQAADPWMSRPMREKFGLPPLEARIGSAAHDFMQGCGAPTVYLTRAVRADGAPTLPSRWLLRLDVVLKAAGYPPLAAKTSPYAHWQSLLDRPKVVAPAAPPAVCPPRRARPRKLSVTQIETWMRDPYAIYARHILRLTALDPLDADPGAADYGTLMHTVLEDFLRAYPGPLPDDACTHLIAMGRVRFDDSAVPPGVRVFWWPRFEKIARRFVDCESERRAEIARTLCEAKGTLTIKTSGGDFELTAKADRLDIGNDGNLTLIDYKTGAPPSGTEVDAGFSPQLSLEAAIARQGGFSNVASRTLGTLLYWRLSADGGPRIASRNKTPDQLADEAEAGLRDLVERFDDEKTPYVSRPHPDYAPRYSDYLHLARVREWATLQEDDA